MKRRRARVPFGWSGDDPAGRRAYRRPPEPQTETCSTFVDRFAARSLAGGAACRAHGRRCGPGWTVSSRGDRPQGYPLRRSPRRAPRRTHRRLPAARGVAGRPDTRGPHPKPRDGHPRPALRVRPHPVRPGRGSRYYAVGTLRMLLTGVPTRMCHGWGEPVHAPLDGEVVVATDGQPERARVHPLRSCSGSCGRASPSGRPRPRREAPRQPRDRAYRRCVVRVRAPRARLCGDPRRRCRSYG